MIQGYSFKWRIVCWLIVGQAWIFQQAQPCVDERAYVFGT